MSNTLQIIGKSNNALEYTFTQKKGDYFKIQHLQKLALNMATDTNDYTTMTDQWRKLWPGKDMTHNKEGVAGAAVSDGVGWGTYPKWRHLQSGASMRGSV